MRAIAPFLHAPNGATKQPDLIHAHTWFSDGAVAHALRESTGIPYCLTVRNTDLNYFWRLKPHLRGLARRVAASAAALIFLGPAYRTRTLSLLGGLTPSGSHVLPNGINDFWLEREPDLGGRGSTPRLLFVGAFTRNKNVLTILKTQQLLHRRGVESALRLVGARNGRVPRSLRSPLSRTPNAEVLAFAGNQEALATHYEWATVFVMPSFSESFGLVYGEALSCGTPIICTRGEGFDGWATDPHCGRATPPREPDLIADAALALTRSPDRAQCARIAREFDWDRVSRRLVRIYADTLKRCALS